MVRVEGEGSDTQPRASHPFAYLDLFRAAPTERIATIKAGVPARKAKTLFKDLRTDQTLMLRALGLKTATVNRKAARSEALSMDESERVLGLARMVGQVQAMIEDSGNGDGFDAAAWLAGWLREPVPALGGVPPIAYLDTMEGQAIVSRTLAQMQGGAYA